MTLKEELPVDQRLSRVYRIGAGLCGVLLLAFGILELAHQLSFSSTRGQRVAELSSKGLLSTISLIFAAILIVGAIIGGNTASTVNMAVGALFVLGGFVNLALLDSGPVPPLPGRS